MGIRTDSIRATGGAAANRAILQVMADVFNAPVHRLPATDAAAVGAALRAWQADSGVPWTEVVQGCRALAPVSLVEPVPANVTRYEALQRRYSALEREGLRRGDTLRHQA